MLKSPGGFEIVGVVGRLPFVEIDNSPDAVFVAIGIGDDGVWGEVDSVGVEDEVFADGACGGEILFDKGRRHGEGFAGVIESCEVGGVDWELASGPEVVAGEVADGVIVFGVAESAWWNRAGIACVAVAFVLAHGPNPIQDGFTFGGRRVSVGLLGRHFVGLDAICDEFPVREGAGDGGEIVEGADVEVAFRFGVIVAGEAVALQERRDLGLKTLFESGFGFG